MTTQELERPIVPLIHDHIKVPGSAVEFSAACFQGSDWSLGPLQEPADAAKNPKLARKLRDAMRHLEADRVYAPNPTAFNAEIIPPSLIDKRLVLGGGIILFRNKAAPADGTFLRSPRDAGIFSAGGCGMLVAVYRGQMIFAHAGRECLLDRVWVKSQGAHGGRRNISVVDSIMQAFCLESLKELAQMHVWPMWFIKPQDFRHMLDDPDPEHRKYNAAARSYLPWLYNETCVTPIEGGVLIDLAHIARLQLLRHDLPEENIHMEHCYLSDELPTTRKGGGRYLAAAVRHT